MSHELTPQEQAAELHDEFLIESTEYKLANDSVTRRRTLVHIDAILDTFNDLWVELAYNNN